MHSIPSCTHTLPVINKSFQDVEEVVTRESWMMELPDKMSASIGLQARQFKSNRVSAADSGDRSGWTDTPADKERKEKVVKHLIYSCTGSLPPDSHLIKYNS